MQFSYIDESKIKSPVKLQCIICTDTFDLNTEHNCLLRNNQEFTIKYTQIKN